MWEQFLAEPWVRVAASPVPTVLTFRRGSHPGWSTPRRLEILEAWTARLARPGGPAGVGGPGLAARWSDWAAGPRHALVDGTITTQPEFSMWFNDVGFGVENHGTEPDEVVEITPSDEAAGRDPQLEAAIRTALALLQDTASG